MRSTMLQTRWIPPDSTAREFTDVKAVVYAYQFDGPSGVRYGAAAYAGKATRAAWHYTFKADSFRDQYIAQWLDRLRSIENRKAERRAEKAAARLRPNPFKVGDILDYAWGYEQTNREFYEVVEVKARTVTIRRIGTKTTGEVGFMTEYLTPKPGAFLDGQAGRPMTKLVRSENDRTFLGMELGLAHLWDGKAKYQSSYA